VSEAARQPLDEATAVSGNVVLAGDELSMLSANTGQSVALTVSVIDRDSVKSKLSSLDTDGHTDLTHGSTAAELLRCAQISAVSPALLLKQKSTAVPDSPLAWFSPLSIELVKKHLMSGSGVKTFTAGCLEVSALALRRLLPRFRSSDSDVRLMLQLGNLDRLLMPSFAFFLTALFLRPPFSPPTAFGGLLAPGGRPRRFFVVFGSAEPVGKQSDTDEEATSDLRGDARVATFPNLFAVAGTLAAFFSPTSLLFLTLLTVFFAPQPVAFPGG